VTDHHERLRAAPPVAPQPVAPQPVAPQPVAPQPVAAQPAAPQPGAARSAKLDAIREAASRLAEQGKSADALSLLKRAMLTEPRAADLWLGAGALAADLGLGADSLKYLEEAVRLDPASATAVELARQRACIAGLPAPAMYYAQREYELSPSRSAVIARKLFLPAIQPSLESIREYRALHEQGLDESLASAVPVIDPGSYLSSAFYLTYQGENDRDLRVKGARMYLQSIPALAARAPHCVAPTRRPGRIRVGFISKFLATHSIGKTTRGLIDKLERDRFEVYALRITPSLDDAMTGLICRAADHAIVLDQDLARARAKIASLGLDILFYQDIGLEPISFLLAFARLAPVQCVSFGHPSTTGIPNMDYFISNDLYETPQSTAHYSERLFLLHDLPTLAYYYRPPVPAAPDRAAFALPEGKTVYLCPQTLFKIHPDFDGLVRGILQRDPRGIAVFIKGSFDEWTEMLRQRFRKSMPEVADRVIFLAGMGMGRFLELLAIADVILDTVHFNGMNSSLESLAVGTPVVTLPTQLQRGRHTQAMYRKMGILDCIATTPEDYVDIAVRLGTNRGYASALRARILERNSVLYEDPRVVDEFQRFFVESLSERYGPAAPHAPLRHG
jgi:hypothetical protein